jgi:hypothetical protein
MKILLRMRGVTLTAIQRVRLRERLALTFGRFGDRVDRVVVRLSVADGAPGFTRCQLDVAVTAALVSVEDSHQDPLLAFEHSSTRAARSVARAIEQGAWGVTS